jgi:hypothetical protein
MTKARDLANAANALDDVSATELGYLDGVTSAIQTQLDAKTAKSTLTTTGDIYYASGANTPARLGIGSTDQVLKVTDGVPAWATPVSGSLTLLSTTSLSGSSVTVSSISQAYKNLVIYVKDMTFASGEAALRLRLNGDTSSNYVDGFVTANARLLPTMSTTGSQNDFMRVTGLQPRYNSANFFAEIEIPDYTNTATAKIVKMNNKFNDQDDSSQCSSTGSGAWSKAPEAIDSITIYLSASTFSSGSIEIYGIK